SNTILFSDDVRIVALTLGGTTNNYFVTTGGSDLTYLATRWFWDSGASKWNALTDVMHNRQYLGGTFSPVWGYRGMAGVPWPKVTGANNTAFCDGSVRLVPMRNDNPLTWPYGGDYSLRMDPRIAGNNPAP